MLAKRNFVLAVRGGMRTVSFGPSTRKLPVPADTAFSRISMLRNVKGGLCYDGCVFADDHKRNFVVAIHERIAHQIDLHPFWFDKYGRYFNNKQYITVDNRHELLYTVYCKGEIEICILY